VEAGAAEVRPPAATPVGEGVVEAQEAPGPAAEGPEEPEEPEEPEGPEEVAVAGRGSADFPLHCRSLGIRPDHG
jgi:hypothetical protein